LALLEAPSVAGLVLVCSDANRESYESLLAEYAPEASIRFVVGGSTRRESVYNGLRALPDSVKIVVVHDAARPLVLPAMIEEAIQRVCQGEAGAIVAIPINDTVKRVNQNHIASTVDRSQLWRAQTPQVFQRALLMQAHEQVAAEATITDDAQLLELAGLGPVSIVPGDERNLKITRPIDVLMAEAFLRADAVPLL
jgi:2-C-methyl-D-erythritol 4-phosphate cytidylyltransferase